MKTIAIVSSHPGAGQITLAVNLASGLVQKGYRVLIGAMGENQKLYNYLGIEAKQDSIHTSRDMRNCRILTSQLGVDLISFASRPDEFPEPSNSCSIMKNKDYDYLFFIPNSKANCDLLAKLIEHLLVCTDFSCDQEVQDLIALEKYLQGLAGNLKALSLIIPNKVNSKEWAHNSRQLFALADSFGMERIADPIPACERLHDLPRQGRTVWQLNQQNLQDAFRRLMEAVEML